MVVHHVEVDEVGAGGDDVAHLLAQAREIGGQDAGRDAISLRAMVSPTCRKSAAILRGIPARRPASPQPPSLLPSSSMPEAKKYERRGHRPRHLPARPVGRGGRTATSSPTRSRITQHRHASPAQLISRHWIITDADNQVQEVRGLGVVGEQPLLQAGRDLRVHQRHRDRDAGRHHARQLPAWWPRTAPQFDAPIPEFTLSRAARAALIAGHPPRVRGAGGRRGRGFLAASRASVHQTMNATSASATPASPER